jgi:hypothetical protein
MAKRFLQRSAKKSKNRNDGFWWYEDIEPNLEGHKLKYEFERPQASAPFDPSPPAHTSAFGAF